MYDGKPVNFDLVYSANIQNTFFKHMLTFFKEELKLEFAGSFSQQYLL